MNNSDSPKPWSPREGRALFLPWIVGLLAFAVLSRVVMFAAAGGPGLMNQQARGVFVALSLMLHGWQAWLLFRPGWRSVVWAALPLLSLATGMNYKAIQMLGIIVPLIETALLAGIRLRPWAWLLAGMGEVIIQASGGALGSGVLALMRNLPLPAQVGIAPTALLSSIMSGLWLLAEIGAAYVLAFWMPPVGGKEPREG